MTILDSIEKDYPRIDAAAGKFLYKLTGDNIQKDIILAAGLSGLKLLRANTQHDLSKIEPGVVLLGAVPDEDYELMERFIRGWAYSNGLDINNPFKEKLSSEASKYLPEVSQYEGPFDEICKTFGIDVAYHPYVAACAAMKLIAAGKKMKLLAPEVGLAMTMYHMIAASKTVPYPINPT
jgi:hypothetical protein